MSRLTDTAFTRPRLWQLLYLTLGAVTVAGMYLSANAPADASHRRPYVHIWTLHSTTATEDTCTESHLLDFSETSMRNRVSEALTGNGTGDWGALGGGRINFEIDTTVCVNQSPTEDAATEFEYHAWLDGSDGLKRECNNSTGTYSCAVPYDYIYDSSGQAIHSKYYWFNLQSSWIASSLSYKWHHIVNHETGHGLGLADPTDSSCPQSVMHSSFYGCSTDYAWPQQNDRDSVVYVMDNTK